MRNRANTRKTATSRPLTDTDDMLILEALRLAPSSLLDCAATLDRAFPQSALAERMRVMAEQMTDLAATLAAQ